VQWLPTNPGVGAAMYNFREIQTAGEAPLAVVSTDTILRRTSEARRFGLRFNKAPVPAAADLVTDLGREIGTARWYRGAATCALLCYATWSLAPEVGPPSGTSRRACAVPGWPSQGRQVRVPLAAYRAGLSHSLEDRVLGWTRDHAGNRS
jgi:hypothetical protein